LKKRLRCVCGGTSASKTVSILLYLIARAQGDKTATLTSVVSESFPHLKRGVIRDFLSIMETHKYYRDERWNKTDYTYTFESGSKIEFFSADQPDKVRGPRRDRLFINEANNIDYNSFDQLEVRTKDFIFLDWNPTNEFWFYTEIKDKRDDYDFITLTYKDNEALDEQIVKSIEQRKENKNWWQVYGLGQLGEYDEKIYTGWQIIDDIPFEARLEKRGVDFGYSLDPTVIENVYYYNGGYIIDEVCYQKSLSNKSIADILSAGGNSNVLVLADSAEPKSIDEIKSYGVNIVGASKGPGSVMHGIQAVQSQKISITKRSVKTINAYRNYCWTKDKNNNIIQVPNDTVHEWSNPMDAIRYAFDGREAAINLNQYSGIYNKDSYN
jgi:phage terminase large subunit